ncbi:AraC family transcriptional regulator [Sphingobacterium sp. 2149]|uniref:AraC family transcriptional regulator n=1 Tax=Sphingobacterium sp. 2149 TaxID=2817763 RepID=UPI0028630C56|nr:AraC family transcriptional regulator [Sphingobacterium sp. 2149]MDR6733494.1 AraC-like DNA-binding protein/quercetin dioxygenase-like cupin family protein [Sphingobacterium sp. 2149]
MDRLSELINRVDQHPDSILVMRQQTEQRLPAHQHDKAQLLMVYGGIAYLQTDEKDFYIPSNHYIWIPAHYPHNLMFNTQDLYIINIYFPAQKSSTFYDELGIYPVSKLLAEMLLFSEKWQGDYRVGSWEFEFLTTLKGVLSQEKLKKFSIQLPTTDDQRLNAITDNIRNRLHEDLSLDTIAQQSGMSVRSLTRLFQTKLHITFVQYLKMLRIIRAMELIKDTDLNMTQIAYAIGYSNIAAFSNNFQQLTNMRPTEFRLKKG